MKKFFFLFLITLNCMSIHAAQVSKDQAVDIPKTYDGVLVISLLKDGKIIDSKKVMK